jgi:hypothetical protein
MKLFGLSYVGEGAGMSWFESGPKTAGVVFHRRKTKGGGVAAGYAYCNKRGQ